MKQYKLGTDGIDSRKPLTDHQREQSEKRCYGEVTRYWLSPQEIERRYGKAGENADRPDRLIIDITAMERRRMRNQYIQDR